jgi:hypothetical protein
MNDEEIDVKMARNQIVSIKEKSTSQTETRKEEENELRSLLVNNEVNLVFVNEIEKVEEFEIIKPVLIAQSLNNVNDVNILEVASLSQISTKSSDIVCRICHIEDTNQNEDLIEACKCKGSLKFVHESCLLKWLTYNRKN